MDFPKVAKDARGAFVVTRIPPLLASALRELPVLLADGAAGSGRRLRESPYSGDDEATEQWRKYAVPELEHLFAEARDLVLQDLQGLRREARLPRSHRLRIPAKHLTAWLSSLAAVRVALGEAHGFTAFEMEASLPPDLVNDRERALLMVHLLGWMQGILVEAGA